MRRKCFSFILQQFIYLSFQEKDLYTIHLLGHKSISIKSLSSIIDRTRATMTRQSNINNMHHRSLYGKNLIFFSVLNHPFYGRKNILF